ncbi:glycosyltransferase family 4 protein [Planococcus ruber]|uniref:glycosyltransferase family 4 protein n=1 Tax=Planococcus ruber TaxID=2027871 RepID=UPI001FEFBB74|nr:glycosyltransferase family 4 protein [Planococcus ruber]MCJ1908276.1 glycosyltransferase family 4 protein [Planococcus ruber]
MAKKNIWIMNHYATNSFFNEAGRHYWFAENLTKNGYNPVIFCADTRHNSTDFIEITKGKYTTQHSNGIPFVFVKTNSYKNNGLDRIKNMVSFYKNIFSVAKKYSRKHGKPDIILASSVHPLTLVAGIKIAKKFGVKCICEVRDLWPESLVAYGSLKKTNPLTHFLYLGERWIYQKADEIIFTIEGGKDYIIGRGWHKENGGKINLKKVHHINNGVDLEAFNYNMGNYILNDSDLENQEAFKVVYTGSIRKVNNVGKIIKVAEMFKEKGIENIIFLIFGNGPDREKLEKYCSDKQLSSVKFKGIVNKKKIPYILSKSDLNIIHFQQNDIKRYGASLNKMFEYFASGKPTISDCEFGYDLIKKYNAGMVLDNAEVNQLAEGILEFQKMSPEKYEMYSSNALQAAKDYNFQKLTLDLIDVIENRN